MDVASLADWRSWINPRNVRGWALLALLLYTLAGFLLVPWLVQSQLPAQSQALIKRTATVERVEFNPFSLQLRAYGFKLADADDNSLLAEAQQLHINVQLRSLFRLAIVLGDLELLEPRIYVTRYAFGDNNLGRLLEELDAAATEAEPTTEEEGGLLRAIADSLVIQNGIVVFEDRMPAEPFSTRLGPINIAVTDISTLPDDSGAQQVNIRGENGVSLNWSGNLAINPLLSSGQLTLSGSPLPVLHRFLREQLRFELDNCCLDIALEYEIAGTPDGGIDAAVTNLDLSLRDVAISADDGSGDVFRLPELAIKDGRLNWPEATASVGSITVSRPELYVWLDEAGELNLNGLLATDTSVEEPATTDATETTEEEPIEWDLRVDAFNVNGMQVEFADRALEDTEPLGIDNINVRLDSISNQEGSRSPLSITAGLRKGGSVTVSGDVGLVPQPDAALDYAVTGLALTSLQPWVGEAAYVSIESGAMSIEGSLITSADEPLGVTTNVSIDNLEVRDTNINEPLVGWNRLQVRNAELSLADNTLEISRIALNEPFGRLLIEQNGSTNFSRLAKPVPEGDTAPEPATTETTASDPLVVKVGATEVANGRLDFTDLSLPLPFRALITEFGGSVSAFASNSRSPSKLDFSGTVGEYGLSTITGSVNLLDPTAKADINAVFRNIAMVEVSPYTVSFVGRKIESGKLDLDLEYSFDERLIRGENTVVLSDFELGEKVPSPDAMSLPLDLAVGLLRDVNGVINMNLSVSGDLDDPSFSASGVILKAFANLITKAVAAPFKLLGALVPGLDSEDSGRISFAAGSAELTPPEREKLALIATALEQRPTLILDVPAGNIGEPDTRGLQQQQAEALIEAGLGDNDDTEQLLRKRRRVVEKLVRDTDAPPLADIRREFTPEATGELDEVAYLQNLETRLADAQLISDEQLQALGNARRDAIVTTIAERGLAPERIRPLDGDQGVSEDGGNAVFELGLETGRETG